MLPSFRGRPRFPVSEGAHSPTSPTLWIDTVQVPIRRPEGPSNPMRSRPFDPWRPQGPPQAEPVPSPCETIAPFVPLMDP